MFYFLKHYAASILLIFPILMSWETGYSYGCYMLFFPLIMLLIISHSFIELKMQQRLCFKHCYFTQESLFAKLLASRVFVSIIYFILSLLMSITLLYGIIDYSRELWLYLAIHILLVILLYRAIFQALSHTIKKDYLPIFAKEWTINISSLLLIMVFIYLTLYQGYVPAYLTDNLQQTISNASNTMHSDCYLSRIILKLKIEIDGLFWWLVSQNAEYFNDQTIKMTLWLLFIFINSLALSGLNRFIVQIIYLIDKLFNRNKKYEPV